MIDYLQKLSVRERSLLLGGVGLLLCLGLYAFAYSPLIDGQKKLDAALANQQQLKMFLAALSTEVAQLRQNQAEQPADNGQSPLTIIEASSSQLDIKPCIKSVVSDDPSNPHIGLEKCNFDKLVVWLAALQKQHGFSVQQIQLSHEPDIPGQVSGKLVLSR